MRDTRIQTNLDVLALIMDGLRHQGLGNMCKKELPSGSIVRSVSMDNDHKGGEIIIEVTEPGDERKYSREIVISTKNFPRNPRANGDSE